MLLECDIHKTIFIDNLARRQLSPALKVVKRIFYAEFDDDVALKGRKNKVPLCNSKLYELITKLYIGLNRREHADHNDSDAFFTKRLERSLDEADLSKIDLQQAEVRYDSWSSSNL
nr:unnamed protein product [Spirometra erinaceieuropaei]